MKKLLLLIPILLLSGCVQEDKSMSLLQREGYENITITGYDFFGCSEDDFYHTGFIAYKNGQRVDGVVCAGLFFKGVTIRFK